MSVQSMAQSLAQSQYAVNVDASVDDDNVLTRGSIRQRQNTAITKEGDDGNDVCDTENHDFFLLTKPGCISLANNSELPKFLQFMLSISAGSSKRNKFLFCIQAFCQMSMGSLLLYGITKLLTLAIGLGMSMAIMMSIMMVTSVNYSEPGSVWNSLLLSDREHVKLLTKRLKAQVFGTAFNTFIAAPLAVYFFVLPLEEEMKTKQPFGSSSWTITMFVCILGLLANPGVGQMQFLNMHMMKFTTQAWAQRQQRYVKRLRELLIELSEADDLDERGPHSKRTVEKIAKLYDQGNQWAINVNRGLSANYAMMAFMPVIMLAMMLIILSFGFNMKLSIGARLLQIFVIVFMTTVCLVMFVALWLGLTRADRDWVRHKRLQLNDVRIKDLVGMRKFVGPELWDNWLQNHELAASRAAGIRVTMTRLYQVGSLVSSAVAFAIYFLVRNQLNDVV
jgi:hypothetical protein